MPDDNRLDLNSDLDNVANDFLKDVEAATKEAKQRKAADQKKDLRNAAKAKDRKVSAIIIAAAAVVLIAIAMWMSFGREPAEVVTPKVVVPQASSRMSPRATNQVMPTAPPRPAPTNQGGGQQSSQPYDDEQPGQ